MRVRLRETWNMEPPGAELDVGSGVGSLLLQRGIAVELLPTKSAAPKPQPRPPAPTGRGSQLPRGQR